MIKCKKKADRFVGFFIAFKLPFFRLCVMISMQRTKKKAREYR